MTYIFYYDYAQCPLFLPVIIVLTDKSQALRGLFPELYIRDYQLTHAHPRTMNNIIIVISVDFLKKIAIISVTILLN